MQIIEAALAFAITMLVLSILCSTLVETIHRILGMREAGFRTVLGEIYDRVIVPGLGGAAPGQTREAFEREMSLLRSPVGLLGATQPANPPTGIVASLWDYVTTLWRGRGLSELTTAGFMERLGSNAVGKQFAAAAASTDIALQDVAQKFEAFSKDASTFFERRARLLSIIVAMFVAFLLHVDAIDLFKSLATDSNARAAVLAMQDEALKANKRMEEQVAAAIKAAPPENLAQLTQLYADSAAKISETQAKLQNAGVAIGWNRKRAEDAKLSWVFSKGVECTAAGKPPVEPKGGKCPDGTKAEEYDAFGLPSDVRLIAGLLLGGLLIGLGGPFWVRTISSIASVRDAARNVPGLSTPTTAPLPPPAPAGTSPTPQPKTPVDVFKVASR